MEGEKLMQEVEQNEINNLIVKLFKQSLSDNEDLSKLERKLMDQVSHKGQRQEQVAEKKTMDSSSVRQFKTGTTWKNFGITFHHHRWQEKTLSLRLQVNFQANINKDEGLK